MTVHLISGIRKLLETGTEFMRYELKLWSCEIEVSCHNKKEIASVSCSDSFLDFGIFIQSFQMNSQSHSFHLIFS